MEQPAFQQIPEGVTNKHFIPEETGRPSDQAWETSQICLWGKVTKFRYFIPGETGRPSDQAWETSQTCPWGEVNKL